MTSLFAPRLFPSRLFAPRLWPEVVSGGGPTQVGGNDSTTVLSSDLARIFVPVFRTDVGALQSGESQVTRQVLVASELSLLLSLDIHSLGIPMSGADTGLLLSADAPSLAFTIDKTAAETTPLLSAGGAVVALGTPPVISNVVASRISDTDILVTWTTDTPSTSQVEYGLTQIYGSLTQLDNRLVTAHSVTLSGLQPSSTYHFRVRSDG